MTSFLFSDIEKQSRKISYLIIQFVVGCLFCFPPESQDKFKLSFENIMENGAFAPNEQMLHFP